MTALDLVIVLWVVIWALLGAGRGLLAQLLGLAGLAIGAVAGARIAPAVLPEGRESVWLPVVALGGALVGGLLAQALLSALASPLRRRVQRGTARRVDRGGGVVLGAALGLSLVWLMAAVVAVQPLERAAGLREEVRRSSILSAAFRVAPPDLVLGALARVDAFTLLPLPAAALPEPDPAIARGPGARAARMSVVELSGRACGVVTQGTGWVAPGGLVVTNVHVVAGQDSVRVIPSDGRPLAGVPVYRDADNDVALLSVAGMDAPALALGDAPRGAEPVTMLGHPGGGPLRAEPATAAAPRTILAPDAYGEGTVARSVVVLRGSLGPGSSGGPVVDAAGRVVAMIFGGTPDGTSGAAVPPGPIRRALAAPHRALDPGPCR